MDIKVLLQILSRPWMMEPQAAQHWAGIASRILSGENIPLGPPKDRLYSDFYRVNKNGELSPNGEVQVLNIQGPIMKYDYCGAPGTQSMIRQLAIANQDDSIKSIVLFIDSPGGSVDGTEDFAKAVKNSVKPVVTYINSMMASAAYWIGSAAKEIISSGANNGYNAVIGSIGTMATWADKTEYNAKQGIKVHEVYATDSVDKNADFKEANAGNYTNLIKNWLDPLNETFVNAIKSNRAGKLSDQENVFTGKTYNAKEARSAGLIDRISSFQEAVKSSLKMANNNYKNNLTMKYNRTLSAAKAENFDALNEGIWLTEENIMNIEMSLRAHEDYRKKTESQFVELQAAADKDTADLQKQSETIERLTKERDELTAKVKELGGQPAPASTTTKQKDEFGTDTDVDHFAHNEWADHMLLGK